MAKHKHRKKRITEIEQVIKDGAQYLEDVAKAVDLRPLSVYTQYRKEIDLPPFLNSRNRLQNKAKRIPIRDDLISQGLTLEEIAKREVEINNKNKVTRERIRQYIVSTGQYDIRKEAKIERNKKESEKIRYLSLISRQIMISARNKLSEDEKWAFDKCDECYSKPGECSNTSFEKLFDVFYEYKRAKENGERVSLRELGRRTNTCLVSVGRFLKKVGEEPLFGARERKNIPKDKKEALKRAINIPITLTNISYFLGLPFYSAHSYYQSAKIDISKRPKVENQIFFDGINKNKKLTYSLASQIYQAEDSESKGGCDFLRKETIEVLDISERAYEYAIEHRNEIEEVIINALKILYPNKNITSPYKNFKD